MQECVNCHRTVLPKQDGTCPNCLARVDVSAHPHAHDDQTLLTVTEVDRFPDLCCRCARPTARRETVRVAKQLQGDNPIMRLLVLLVSPFTWMATPGGVRSRLRIALPLCELCRAQARLEPTDVRFEDYTMQFVVHREFRRRVEAQRRPA
jgi:hypothetical protein